MYNVKINRTGASMKDEGNLLIKYLPGDLMQLRDISDQASASSSQVKDGKVGNIHTNGRRQP